MIFLKIILDEKISIRSKDIVLPLKAKWAKTFGNPELKQWTNEKDELYVKLLALEKADISYIENANLAIELANNAAAMFKSQTIDQKRKLFNLLTGNCHYINGKLDIKLKPVFACLFDLAKNGKWWS